MRQTSRRLLFAATGLAFQGKIVIPTDMRVSDIPRFVGGDAAKSITRRKTLNDFAQSMEKEDDKLFYDSKPHMRQQDKNVQQHGLEHAVRESLNPSQESFRAMLRKRPIDRRILEEIYADVHGKRTERMLKKGLHWERWVAEGEQAIPVHQASDSAKKVFGYGGKIEKSASAKHVSEFPISSCPEIAFVGRTNVGKSSLINSLLNAYSCNYGHLPGTTTSVDFYSVGEKLTFVDLPGWGYYNPIQTTQAASHNAKQLLKEYLRECGSERKKRNIKRVYVCVSCRGVQDNDWEILAMLEKLHIPFGVVITKTDTAPVRYLARFTDYTRSQLVKYSHCHELMLSSSLRLSGISRMQTMIANMSLRAAQSEDPISADMDSIV